MRIIFHTGTPDARFDLFQKALVSKRKKLNELGFLLPIHAGLVDHASVFFAGSRKLGWHPLHEAALSQDIGVFRDYQSKLSLHIAREITQSRPHTLILTMRDLWNGCPSKADIQFFISTLAHFSDDIHLAVQMSPPENALFHMVENQISYGRTQGFEVEQAIADASGSWFEESSEAKSAFVRSNEGDSRFFAHCALPSIDQINLLDIWKSVLGAEAVRYRALPSQPTSDSIFDDMKHLFDLPGRIGRYDGNLEVKENTSISMNWASKALSFNKAMNELRHEDRTLSIPLRTRLRFLKSIEFEDTGPLLFENDLGGLVANLDRDNLHDPMKANVELPSLAADPDFNPKDSLEAIKNEALAIAKANKAWVRKRRRNLEEQNKTREELGAILSEDAGRLLNDLGRQSYISIKNGRFRPRNHATVAVPETDLLPQLSITPSAPKTDSVLIACMKDEAPYILEWVAYHKSIGVDHFVVFTNHCSDGTVEILERLQELGLVTHVDNSVWKGKSPQQAALNRAIKMPIVQNAKWLIHIDVDEYINIRYGNGTLSEVLDDAGDDTTNIAMTWRLFGNAGIEGIDDGRVIERFTKCAPSYAPKPHTMWGFKTITRNVGVYKKLGCHRPNQPIDNPPVPPKWVNGSLRDMTMEGAKPGTWRSSPRSIGYDAIQLNHYALRSRDSYLIKRQRGRALHTDRTIGLNYWIRHDWNTYTDLTILRHADRMNAIKSDFLNDGVLGPLHAAGIEWHKSRALELIGTDVFSTLRNETKNANLDDLERVAYALAADMES